MTAPRWRHAFWTLTCAFLVFTALFYVVPQDPRFVRRAVHFLSFEFEQNLATWYEGTCFFLVGLLAFERSLGPGPVWAWRSLSVLGVGLSLDELCSIHERSDLLFKPIGLDDQSLALLPFAIPAAVIAVVALAGFYKGGERRRAVQLAIAFALLGSVVFQEKLEHKLHLEIPAAWAPVRGVVEEGTELVGVYFLLSILLEPGASVLEALPSRAALRRVLLPTAVLGALGIPVFLYIGWATRVMQYGRGIPMAFVPYAITTILAAVALRAARDGQERRGILVLLGLAALFFSLDEIAVLERVDNVRLMRSALEIWALPVMGLLAMLLPRLHSVRNVGLLCATFALSYPVLTQGGRLWPWVAAPTGLFVLLFIVTRGLTCDTEAAS